MAARKPRPAASTGCGSPELVSSSTCAGEGTSSEADGGVEYHRIGRDLIEELLEAMSDRPVLAAEAAAISTAATMSTLDVIAATARRGGLPRA